MRSALQFWENWDPGGFAGKSWKSMESLIHNKTRHFLTIACMFGVFPVKNIYKKNIQLIQTKKASIVYCYSYLMCIIYMLISSYALEYFISNFGEIIDSTDGLQQNLTPLLYFGSCTVSSYFFINIANEWPQVIRKWSKLIEEIKYLGTVATSKYFLAALMISGQVNNGLYIWRCSLERRTMDEDFSSSIKTFSTKTSFFLVSESTYSTWKGVIILLLTISSSFVWNFADIFIIMVSSILSSNLTAFNKYHCSIRKIQNADLRWKNFRKDYFMLKNFIKMIDARINKLIALSVFCNGYFINTIILQAITQWKNQEKEDMFSILQITFLLAFVLVRVTYTLISAASVSQEWKEMPWAIYTCPSQQFSQEADRLLQDIHAEPAGLSAGNLIRITRSSIMGIYGFLLSYEIILLSEPTEPIPLGKFLNKTFLSPIK